MYQVTKTYDSITSVAFRQWRAKGHCQYLHGYALSFKLTFEAQTLSEEGWVVGFGDLTPIREFLESEFDHQLLVARDDPQVDAFKQLEASGIARITWMDQVCCEAIASVVLAQINQVVFQASKRQVRCVRVEVNEHRLNSAICQI